MVNVEPDGTVDFAFFRPSARTVHLAGESQPAGLGRRHTMRRDDRGWWRLRLRVKPGEYRFHYLVDGERREADFAAYGVESDHGQWKSVIWIAPHSHLAALPQ